MGWLSGWDYRKKITINGKAGAGTSYKVRLKAFYKELSNVYADFTEVLPKNRHVENPILECVDGTWENWQVFDPCIVDFDETRYAMYYSGMEGNADDDKKPSMSAIGVAFCDKENFPFGPWTKHGGNPILEREAAGWENCGGNTKGIRLGSVIKVGSTFYMFYSNEGADAGCVGKIGLATSNDGLNFVKHGSNPILSPEVGEGEGDLMNPAVIKVGSTWYMYYSNSPNEGSWQPTQIRVATSNDGVNWTKQGTILQVGGGGSWDDYMIEWHSVIKLDDKYVIVYEGNNGDPLYQIGLAHNANPLTAFTKYAGNPFFKPTRYSGEFDRYHVATPLFYQDGEYIYLFFTGLDASALGDAHLDMGVATNLDHIRLYNHCKTDFGDIRFTDDDGTTLLNYWMEEKVDSDYAIFWVEVTDDLGSDRDIYIYYGKADATTTGTDFREDFTDVEYIEVDPNNHVDIPSSTHIDHDAYCNEDAYLYDDKGVDYFDDFEHNVDVRCVSTSARYAVGVVWLLSNDIDDARGLHINNKTYIVLYMGRWTAVDQLQIKLHESVGGSGWEDASIVLSYNTMYYLKIVKFGTHLYCGIYSTSALRDAGNGTDGDVDNLTLTLQADHNFRCIFGCNTWNSGNNYFAVTDIENLFTRKFIWIEPSFGAVGSEEEPVSAPTVTTQDVTNVEETTAIGHGTITDIGDENCDKRGVCWNTAGNPTVADNKSEEIDDFGAGSFDIYISGLSCETHYYVRAYAHNSGGYGYGSQVEFTTGKCPKGPLEVSKRWKVFIQGSGWVEYPYIDIDFEKVHPNPDPDSFTITLSGKKSLPFFSPVQIKKDDVLRFYGYIESINYVMGAQGINTIISGRGRKVILWKKWTERFTDTRISGFFGKIYPEELIRFLLRCPISDTPDIDEGEDWERDFPRQKIGWGINSDKIMCEANESAMGTFPNYAKLRLVGFYWRNRGSQGIDRLEINDCGTPDCDGTMDWTENGGAGTCYGHVNSDDGDISYIYSGLGGIFDTSYDYCFQNLGGTVSGINGVTLYVKAKCDGGCWGFICWGYTHYTIRVWIFDGSNWHLAGIIDDSNHEYQTYKFDVTSILDTPAKVNSAKIRFENYGSAHVPLTGGDGMRVSYAYLSVDRIINGTQECGDWFKINLGSEVSRVTGIIIQSRNSSQRYAKHYVIEKIEDVKQDLSDVSWSEQDPNNHITVVGTDHIDFDAWQNEIAYFYKDFGVDYFNDFYKHRIKVKVVTDITEGASAMDGKIFGFWCVANTKNDLIFMQANNLNHISLHVWKDPADVINGGEPCFRLWEENAGVSQSTVSATLSIGTTYRFEIEKSCGIFTVEIYNQDTGAHFDTLELSLNAPNRDFRYLILAQSCNDGSADNCDCDIDDLVIEEKITLASKSSNLAQDIIHSWSPTTIENIRIRITQDYSSNSWEITQVYIYRADEADYTILESTKSPNISLIVSNIKSKSSSPYLIEYPINIPFQRLTDAMEQVRKAAFDSNYEPWEWWIDMADGEIYFDERKGSTKADKIFEANFHLAGATKGQKIGKTVQRLRVVGRGEGRRQDEVSSQWKENTEAMKMEEDSYQTFYEELISEKTISGVETANAWAEIYLTAKKDIIKEIEVEIQCDPYPSGSWDVGDDVTLSDSRVDITEQTYRIKKLHIHVDGASGEIITLTVTNAWEDITDRIATFYKKILQLELTGTVVEDWTAEGSDQGKVKQDKMENYWEMEKKYEESNELQDVDPNNQNAYYTEINGVANIWSDASGMEIMASKEWLEVKGNTNNANGRTLRIYGGAYWDGAAIATVRTVDWDQEPRFIAKFEIKGDDWELNETDPYIRFGMMSHPISDFFGFYIIYDGSNYTLYAAKWDNGSETTEITRQIFVLSKDVAYEVEAKVDWNDRLIFYYVDGIARAVIPLDSDVATGASMYPMYIYLMSNNDGAGGDQAIVDFWSWKSQAKKEYDTEED